MVDAWYMLVQVIGTCFLVQVYWYKLLQVDSDRLIVAMVDLVTVTGCLHLAFIFQHKRMGQGKGVVSSFRLV